MYTDQIEKMKREYTDKYVLVDGTRPELARFRDVVGRVRTVNMNGRALVEFDDYHLNIGWYDIAPEYLKVVDKPPPKAAKPEAKKGAPKAAPAAKKPAGEAASAAGKAAAPKAGKPSVADILAAARAGKGGGAAPAKTQAEAKPAAAGPQAAAPTAPKVDRSKMSVADMLAAARAGGAAGSAPATKPKAELAPAEESEEEAGSAAPAAKPPAAVAKSTEKVDKSKMTIDDIIAWCRAHDTK
jgi:hypothetical protein